MCVVPVRIKHGTSKVWGTYAVLESCTQGTFLDEQLLDELKILKRKTTITVKILDSEVTEFTGVAEALKVTNGAKKNLQKERWITTLPKIYTRKDLAVESDAVKSNQILKWKYLEQIKNELNLNSNVKVGVFIGANCLRALEL